MSREAGHLILPAANNRPALVTRQDGAVTDADAGPWTVQHPEMQTLTLQQGDLPG